MSNNIEILFDNIASNYDRLNHILSFGIDRIWRRKTANIIANTSPCKILDVAAGTADMSIELRRKTKAAIYAIDISEKMIEIGRQKIEKLKLDNITLEKGCSDNIPFEDNIFDAVTIAFGVRNFQHREKSLSESFRVLKPQGIVAILEFSYPTNKTIKWLYDIYFNRIMPFVGTKISNDTKAYRYLRDSVHHFPKGEEFLIELRKAGYSDTIEKRLCFGIVSLYMGKKNS